MPPKFFDHRDIKWPGTWLVENTLPSAVPNIPHNRTLYAQQLTAEAPSDVEFVDDCQTLQDVFNHFQPGVNLELKNEEGVGEDVEVQFRSLQDFGREGIINQSDLLNKISGTQKMFEGFMEKLTDEQLHLLLSNPEEKAAYVQVLQQLIDELEAADAND